jgi:methionyl-tRNA formyltransferase
MDQTDEADTLRLVYAGTPEFSVPALEALDASDHELVGVFTNPDRPRGRGRDPLPPPVKKAAVERDIEVAQPESMDSDEAAATLEEWEADVMVVCAYGQILPERILDAPRLGCINIHASLLPKYRGAAPINWAIVRGEQETGVTIMEMEPGLDTGPMLMKERVELEPLTTAGELHDELSELGADLIVEAVNGLARGDLEATPQDDDRATHAPKLSKSDGEIDWTKSADEVANHIRGLNPWPGAFSHHRTDDEGRIKFHLARPVGSDGPSDGEPGEVLEADPSRGRLVIACGEGAIECLEIQAPGRQKMEAGDFLNGYDIEPGDRFGADK